MALGCNGMHLKLEVDDSSRPAGEDKGFSQTKPEDDTVSNVSTDLGCEYPALRASSPVQSEDAFSDSPSPIFLPYETLIIFDWDDTICPTTWLGVQGLLTGVSPSQEQIAQLKPLADAALVTLNAAKANGEVAVVTNAEKGWVEWTCLTFMPSLQMVLQEVDIISARSCYEQPGLFDPTLWKCRAFADKAHVYYAGKSPGQRRNIISIGDALYERDALMHVTSGMADCWAKSVKLLRQPDLMQLVDQHELIGGSIHEIVDHDNHLDFEVDVQQNVEFVG